MAAIASPITHAQMDGGAIQFRQAFALLRQEIMLRLVERASLRTSGLFAFLGDLARSGSDTLRSRYYDGIGFGASFSSVSETATPSLSSLAAEVQDTAIGRWHLGYSQTYMDQVLRGIGEIGIEDLASYMVDAWEGTWMGMVASTIAGAATDLGVAGVNYSFDDYLSVVAYFRTLDGFSPVDGALVQLLHGQQFVDFGEAIRSEPSFQLPEPTNELLKVRGPGYQFDLMGVSNYQSNRVTSSGGNRNGAAFTSQAMKWVLAGTSDIRVANPATAVVVPELGMVVELDSTSNGATSSVEANAFMGMAIHDADQIRGVVTDA